jgi:uroporphyrinogen-III synthase
MKIIPQPKTYAVFANPANRKLVEELENNGSKVFQFAPLETVRIESKKTSEIIKKAPSEYNWIIFPDVYSVEYFLEILEKMTIDLFELDEIRIVACGEAVADKLRFVQLHVDIITTSEDPGDVIPAVINYVGETEIADTSFFIPKEIGFSSGLKGKLIEAGAKAAEMPVYQILINDKKEITKLKTLLKGGAIDEFIFTSPEDVFFIKIYVSPEVLPEIFSETIVSGTNEISVQSLNENKLGAKRFYNIKRG